MIDDAGAVQVLYGSSGGLSTVNSLYLQDGRVNDTAEAEDHFGAALAVGNFNGDSNPANGEECMDLAVGVPGEDLGSPVVEDAGFVYIMLGGTSGISTTGDHELHQDLTGVADSEEVNDRFGAVVEAVDDGTYWGLVVQVPGEACSSTSENVGSHRFYGGSAGITTAGNVMRGKSTTRTTLENWGILVQIADIFAIRVLANM